MMQSGDILNQMLCPFLTFRKYFLFTLHNPTLMDKLSNTYLNNKLANSKYNKPDAK